MRPCSPLPPPKMTALLLSTAVKVRPAHGGGLSPVVAGQLHTPAVEIEETVKEHYMHDSCVVSSYALLRR